MVERMKGKGLRRSGAIMLAFVLACTLVLSACSSNSKGSNKTDAGNGENTAPKNAVTLKVEVFDRGNSPSGYTITDNYLTRYVQDNFGTPNNINVQFVPVPRSEEVQKLNVLMASSTDVPDIVFTYDTPTFNRYAQQGGLMELTELINEHGPNLKAFLGEELLDYGKYMGEQLSIPAKRTNLGKYSSFIRKDWLDKLELPIPQTTDELYTTLKAFKEKDPGNTGGKVIPFGMTIASAQYEPLIWSFIEPMTDEEKYTLTQQLGSNDFPTLLPGFKDALLFMNKLYNEGLISLDFGLDHDKKKLGEDISSGKIGFFSEDDINIYYQDGSYDTLLSTVPGAEILAVDVFTNSEGKHAKPEYSPQGMYIMIPKSSKNAVEAIKYLDWMASGDHLFHMQNGIEGENYVLEGGYPIALDNPTEEATNRLYNSGDMAIISNGKNFGSREENLEARALQFPPRFQDQAREAMRISNADTIKPVLMDRPIDAEAKYGTSVYAKFQELLVKATMAKPENFENDYASGLRDYMESGGQAILDERIAVYKEMSAN